MTDTTDRAPIRRALLSVSDKSGVADLARALAGHGVELVSTGGTAKLLRAEGLEVRDVSDLTGFSEVMDGRVKTLHPGVHGGLLADRDKPQHVAAMEAHGIAGIDLLVVNLYPFEATLASGADDAAIVENIDIGGPAMIRAGAKNHAHVAVVTDPEDYAGVAEAAGAGGTTLDQRRRLAGIAYARTAQYDQAISAWMERAEAAPRRAGLSGTLSAALRYGENPHQGAAAYTDGTRRPGVLTARQVQGKALSYNNLADTDAAYELVAELPRERAGVAIIKHANPCGVASRETIADAYEAALRCDPVSAFGGIVALSRPLDGPTAEMIAAIFTEVVIAPGADDAAKAAFARKKNLRLLLTDDLPDPGAPGTLIKPIAGGFLRQDKDTRRVGADELRVVTKRQPTEDERADLLFAFTVAKHVKSNAIVYAKDGATVGIGAGQMSRIDSTRIAAIKSEDAAVASKLDAPLVKGSVVASDAFFPFADGLLAAASAGATAVIQPGGSIRDEEVIRAADEEGLAMVFTGVRHFRH